MEVQIWVLTGLISGLSAILIIIFKTSLHRLISRLDKLIDQVRELTENVRVHRNEIDGLEEKNQQQDERLNSHSERIRALEINQHKNK